MTRTSAKWLVLLEKADISCSPINSIDKVFENHQIQYREMKLTMEHALAGSVPLLANPLNFSETPVKYNKPPPSLGVQTDEILKDWLELGDGEISRLRCDRII